MQIEQINKYEWKIPKTGKMLVDGIVYASSKMMEDVKKDEALKQVENVACLPGIVKASFAMPDIHWGYGFPIGGVAAFDENKGIVSPGGVGYDINCGVRLLRSDLELSEVENVKKDLITHLFNEIPTGIGSHHKNFKLTNNELEQVLVQGAKWANTKGYADKDDLDFIEDNGCLLSANPDSVSKRAFERGRSQMGTLGSGNHFIEIGVVTELYDESIAKVFGLFANQITIMIHTGSRGLGHQICDDNIYSMLDAANKYHIHLPDKQLCCAPITSPEARKYLEAMSAGANFAYANRQMITYYVREVFEKVLKKSWEGLGLHLIYDVAHNIAKFEEHIVNKLDPRFCGDDKQRLLVHRKGATRAFPSGHPSLPQDYKKTGQPVLIPGDMGRYSYVSAGTSKAMELCFGSACHGAGRVMSRHRAKKMARARDIQAELAKKGILIKGASYSTIVEEMPDAYKDVAGVVDVVDKLGIAKKVAKIEPIGVIKG